MTKSDYEAALEQVHARRDASLRKLKRQGLTLDQIAAQTGFGRRLVAEICCEPRASTLARREQETNR